MDLDPGIVCFIHCSRRMFCFTIPDHCPTCQLPLKSNLFPFRVPYPFIRAAQYNCSIVIKSTDGNFLKDYVDNDDLHIGVTSSRGELFEFDYRGLTCGSAHLSWDQSLLVYRETCSELFPIWDSNLQKVADISLWAQSKYDEDNFNCYDFVLTFFQTLGTKQCGDSSLSKADFIRKYVSPVIVQAMKYIKLYRQVEDNGVYISDIEPEFLDTDEPRVS